MDIFGQDRDSKEVWHSGYFRDGKRRIDLVLVSKETNRKNIERLKMTFLSNCLNIDIQMEVEAGMADDNRDLLFIKLHAPDHVIKHFGYYYNIKKYFKKTHIEFINSYVQDEKEIIRLIRREYSGPVGYSNAERSMILFKILLSVPFGLYANFIGIDQLLKHDVFLDMYPLHDGPWYFIKGQNPAHFQGRQALCHVWCHYPNLFRLMPIHLIREYFGERIAFFFAFYQFYNIALFLLSLGGIGVFIANFVGTKGRKIIISKFNDYVCPRCFDTNVCPYLKFEHYQHEIKSKLFLDNPFNYILISILTLWGFLLYILWRRHESYLYLMWETNEEDAKSLTRPKHRNVRMPDFGNIGGLSFKEEPTDKELETSKRVLKQMERTYRRMNMESGYKTLKISLWLVFCVIFIICIYLPLMTRLEVMLLTNIPYKKEANAVIYNKTIVVFCGVINGLCIVAFEKIWWKIWKSTVKIHNPRSEHIYETHYANLYGVSLLMNFILIFFYAFLKNAFYTNIKPWWRYYIPFELSTYHCGILTCLDEVFLMFFATFKTKICFQEYSKYIYKYTLKNDIFQEQYDEDEKVLPDPVWEREFKLTKFREDDLTQLYYNIFLQYAIVTFFVTNFQLGPLIASIYNFWEMRYVANLLVLHCRRPIFTQTWGLGYWNYILFTIPFLATMTNVLYMVFNNTVLHRRASKVFFELESSKTFLHDFFYSPMLAGCFNISTTTPTDCMIPASSHKGEDKYNCTPLFTDGEYYVRWHKALVVLLYAVMTIMIAVILNYKIGKQSRSTLKYIETENCVKTYEITKEMASTKKTV